MGDFIRSGRLVLVFSPHTADICSHAGGIIAQLSDAGSMVHIVNFSYGKKSESPAFVMGT